MPLSLMIAPAVVQAVESYAEAKGTTINVLVQSYLEDLANRERERRRANEEMMAVADNWVADAEAEKAMEEMCTIDLEMWK